MDTLAYTLTDWRQALLTNREKTLERLYARTYPMVLHYLKGRQGTAEDAKDLLQDAMIILFEKVVHEKITLTAAPSTYLMAICKNRWKQELEKRSRKAAISQEGEVKAATEELSEMGPAESKHELLSYIEALGDKCRNLLVDFYYFGQLMDQLTSQYGYRNIHTATVQKFKCLERLRKAVSHLSLHHFQ